MAISLNEPTTPEAGVGAERFKKWAIALFFVALFIPGSINVGIKLDVYRGYLLAMAIPTLLQIRNDPTLRINSIDVLVFLAVFWRALSLVVNHQAAELVNAGSGFLELFFGYLLGRAFIRSAADYRYFFKCFLVTLVAFLPFALVEFAFHRRLLSRIAGLVLTQPPEEFGDQIRFGFMRVQVSFEHALLFGSFCALGFANAFYVFGYRYPRNLIYAGFVGFMTFLAISTTSILTIALQCGLIAYEKVLRAVRAKWIILLCALPFLWFLFQMIVGKNFVDFIADELVINPYVGDGRKEIFYWGMREAIAHPVFGIGKNDWARPFWREHPTADNFWVASAMRYGFPHVGFLLAAFVLQIVRTSMATGLDAFEGACRRGFAIALAALTIALVNHGLWGVANVFVMLYLGVGSWVYDRTEPGPRRRIPAARTPRSAAPPPRPAPAPARPGARTAGRSTGPFRGGRPVE